mmetsp:Transcript_32313/g.55900  ORF Transcript_32313/g.55900 Transcript_32313/m.55900 type:complete len:122 (+) Transcript_32313:39-404(+)
MSKRPVKPVEEETKQVQAPLEKPKKPLSAYMLFTMDRRQALKAAKTEISSKELLKEMGREWKALDLSRKQVYEGKAEALKNQYKLDVEAFGRLQQESQQEKPKRKPKPADDGGKRKKPVRS